MEVFYNDTKTVTDSSFETEEYRNNNYTEEDVIQPSVQFSTKTTNFIFYMEFWGSFEYMICFLANILTITAVVKFDYLHRKATNILILSLSIADGLLGIYL